MLDGSALDAREQQLFEICTGRTTRPTERPAEVWLICGRRAGKSRFAAACAVHAAAFQDYTMQLAAGEVAIVALAGADREQAQTLLKYVTAPFTSEEALRSLVRQRTVLESLRGLVTRQTQWGIGLQTRVNIEVKTAHYGKTRGRSYAYMDADEVRFWHDDSGSNPASAVLNSIRPGLATLNGWMCVPTTPYAKNGPTWETFSKYWGTADPHTLVWKAPTLRMHPSLPARVVEDALRRDEQSARSEWLAEFRDDLSALVTSERLRAVVVPGRGPLLPRRGVDYLAFIDVSTGGGQDSMCLAIVHGELAQDDGGSERGVIVVDQLLEARPPFDPLGVAREFASMLKMFGCWSVSGDAFAGGWTNSVFERLGLTPIRK